MLGIFGISMELRVTGGGLLTGHQLATRNPQPATRNPHHSNGPERQSIQLWTGTETVKLC
jgi:hypothetical protein